jgi:hypothetical protein
MTSYQERAIEKIKRIALEDHGKYADNYELKQFEVHENEYFVSLIVEVGMKGDEGTMASIFARDRGQVFIGKRGGVTIPVSKMMKDGKRKHYYKRWSGCSFYEISLAQK